MKKIQLAIFFVCLASLSFPQTDQSLDRKEILKVLEDQRIAWNSGNLDEYMQGYWKSDSLRFVGKNGVRYGWNETLDAYKKGYPTQKEMGNLTFSVVSLEFLSEVSAYMIGKWTINREENSVSGHFMLIWKKINGKWFVTADHSS